MNFRRVGVSEVELICYSKLFSECFPGATQLTPAYLRWLYAENPMGNVVGVDAWDGDSLAAHYVCIPVSASINGRVCRILLSLNTATHPKYQGKGLFTRLAEATYERGMAEGFEGAYGVANANSTPGFIRKLGFTLISPLDAQIGFGSIADVPAVTSVAPGFSRVWEPTSLAWRISNPMRSYRLVSAAAGKIGAEASTGKLGLVAWAELPESAAKGTPLSSRSLGARLHLGLTPRSLPRRGLWVNVPERFRSSPLNLIYRSFSALPERLEAGNVSLGQLDFDAF